MCVPSVVRIYIAANSGARIGVSESLKKVFRVAWRDDTAPNKGYEYLFLSRQDYLQFGGEAARIAVRALNSETDGEEKSVELDGETKPASVVAKLVEENGEERWRIEYIIGEEKDLGVENLRGSGTIAGDTARAYNNIFTLTYVAGRSVGIGAYLVRLGQRTIQKRSGAPIILTGFQALNTLMGRNVYSSNEQLGGVNVMYNNGVSHEVVNTDLEVPISSFHLCY